MRVLHLGKFYPPHRGGMETHLAALIPALRSFADVEVIVASESRRTTVDHVNGVEITRAARLATVAATPICPSLFQLVRSARADIIHIHHPNPFAMFVHLTVAPTTPLVITYHTDIVRQRVLGQAVRPLLAASFAQARAVLVTSPAYLESSAVLNRLRGKSHVVTLGIDVQEFADVAPSDVDAVKRKHAGPIVLAVGRLVYYKGFDHLIDAMRTVQATLIIVGTGPMQHELEARAAAAGVARKVVFAGDVADVKPYYAAADVFVLPSVARSEAFGIVQLEAMAAGVPVVNTGIDTGVAFVSRHEQTGLTVPPADAGALAGAINRLLADPALRRAYGAAGVRRVREHFGAPAMARATYQIYEDVMAPCGARAALDAEEPA
ncbi:MAG: hypothetical protein DMF87_09360 [Acidobacteria bacterium]|nr:MAG: hypothetical protein DMF87_09360 [Acidobacteriota bacterium]